MTDSGGASDDADISTDTVSGLKLDQTLSSDDESTVSELGVDKLDLHVGSDIDFD